MKNKGREEREGTRRRKKKEEEREEIEDKEVKKEGRIEWWLRLAC